MGKVIFEETYGIWEDGVGIKGVPMCPKCKEPTYNEENCPFCGEKLEYKEDIKE